MVDLNKVLRDVAPIEPAPYGLLSPAVNVVRDGNEDWQSGFSYRKDNAITVEVISTDMVSASASIVTPTVSSTNGSYARYRPFLVLVNYKASTIGNTRQEVEEAVEAYVEAATQKAVEREFWNGIIAQGEDENESRFLSQSSATDVTPSGATGGIKTKFGMALLEQAIGDYGVGERGFIHATRGTASALGIKGQNGKIETPIGNYLIAGTGYTGVGPGGTEPAGTADYMYATGPVTVRLGEPFAIDGEEYRIDVRKNTIEYTVARAAAVTWSNDCHYSVLVDLSLDYS